MQNVLVLLAFVAAAVAILAMVTLAVRLAVLLIHAYMQREREITALRDARDFIEAGAL